MKDHDQRKESPFLKYWDVYSLYGWAMSRNLPLSNLKWVGEKSEFNEDLIKSYNDKSSK